MATTSAPTTAFTTAPSSTTDVLILKSYDVPVLTNANGKDDRDIDFIMGENTDVFYSCSLTWRGEHYVFGGYNYKR